MSGEGSAPKRQRKDVAAIQEAEADAEDAVERACDNCRNRRVKCDKTTPCSNCRRRKETCHTTVTAAPEPRSRGFLTKRYEEKIDLMANQLDSMERLLRQQQSALASLVSSKGTALPVPLFNGNLNADAVSALPSPESQSTTTADPDASDATTGAHSTVAHKLVEQAVESSPGIYQDSELFNALQSLKDMVGRMEDGPNSLDNSKSSWCPLDLRSEIVCPPSPAEMRRLVDDARESVALGFTPGLTVETLRDKCGTVSESGSKASPIRRIYVYGTLRNLCAEFGGRHQDAAFAKRCRSLVAYFSVELGHAVNDLKLIVPVTEEAASALTMASGAAMELCRPLIAQSLGSKAASIVLSLGYNRLNSMRSDDEPTRQIKILTFWMAYWLDTSFSVRLGRTPIIRPHDIAVPQLSEDSIIPKGWAMAFNYSTRISGLQCKVVEQLYTPVAVQQSLEERRTRAVQLTNELDKAWDSRGPGPNSVALWRDSDAVMHWSTVCLVQHATMSAGSSESPALESARRALNLHVTAWETHKHLPDFIWSGHCHWTLLKGPITPFVVVFCHIIAHPFAAYKDLQLLANFIETLGHLRRFSDGVVRLHRLCDIFIKVATLYVRAKVNEASSATDISTATDADPGGIDSAPAWAGQPAVDDIDEYLSSIGFAPQPVSNINSFSDGTGALPDLDPSFLMDWYHGNNSLMGFLEQDLAFTGAPGFDSMTDPSM